MAKVTMQHRCTECGWTSTRWVGRCGECQTWGSVVEVRASAGAGATAPTHRARRMVDVPAHEAECLATGLDELDRVLGGGLVPGAVVLLAGEPGVGKSTLLLEVAQRWAENRSTALYVSAEESAAQIRGRANRTGALSERLYVAAESDLGELLGQVDALSPGLLVVDSVQTISATGVDGITGGVTQVREVTSALVRVAKARGMAVLIIGHVTKEGAIAGPRTLEHLVDVVLSFEGDKHSGFRMVRASKNRFGPSDEVGCFEMVESGIVEVADPSGLFTSQEGAPRAGTCLTVSLDGRRPLIAEVQALVAPNPQASNPRRHAHGLEMGRFTLTLAVLERKARLQLYNRDVYASTVGGARLVDPASDLAVAIAVASATADFEPAERCVALGEVGLSGEVRRVSGLARRLGEAARLGVRAAIVPRNSGAGDVPASVPIQLFEVGTVAEAIAVALSLGAAETPEPRVTRPRPVARTA